MKLDPVKTKAVVEFCNEMSASFTRMTAERDFQKEAVAHIVEKYELGKEAKKILKKMAKVNHNAKFQSLVEESTEFEETFRSVFGMNE